MTAIDSAFRLIDSLRKINLIRQRVIYAEGAHYPYQLYRDISTQFKELTSFTDGYLDLFFLRLSCEIPDKQKFKSVIALLSEEISSFENWYIPNSELVNSLFSHEIVAKKIDEDAEGKYGLELNVVTDDCSKAEEDEKTWHNLARAYGSRVSGDYDENSFSKEDWDYIKDSLEDFKKHFKKDNVNLSKMYEEYDTIMKPRLEQCQAKRNDVLKRRDDYKVELISEYEDDVYAQIHSILTLLSEYLPHDAVSGSESSTLTIDTKSTGNRLGRYRSLRECIPREDIFEKVDKLARDYYEQHGSIDGVFGYSLLKKLKGLRLLNEKGCAQNHFGDLLINEYGSKCSFKNGGAIYDGKDKTDPILDKMMDHLLGGS